MTPIDFGKDFLNKYFDQKDADACKDMLAGDLVWITPEDMHHFLSEGAVLKFLRKSIADDGESRYVDLISIKSSPSAENIMTVAYEVNLVSREDERPLYLRCSMAICRRNRRLEITFLHFSRKTERDSSEQLRGFLSNLPCGVMILACLDGQREEVIYYNDYFAHRLRYSQEEFARAMERNPFFMTSEEDRDRVTDQIEHARKTNGSIAVNLRFFRKDGNSFYYRMMGAPAYQADGGTVYYCVFQEITGFQLTTDRLQSRLETAKGILRQIPEGICAIEYAPGCPLPGEMKTGTAPRIFFTSRNLPALFDVSNSAYAKNITQDPFFGLEITSISRDKLMRSRLFGSSKQGSMGPVSCGIFRVKKQSGRRISAEPAESAESADSMGSTAFTGAPGRDSGNGSGRAAELSAPEKAPVDQVPSLDREPPRVEFVVRRVREKNGTVRLYFFYYDREAREKETEQRIDRAMKMGRAGQDQLRSELKKAKESAARRQSEMRAALQTAQEKYDVEISRAEDRLLEEKNRAVLLSRQLEESKAARKQMASELERTREESTRRIRNTAAGADQRVREASAARDLLEEQLREAQERNRRLEQQLHNERTRRLMLEEQLREKGQTEAPGRREAVDPTADWMHAAESMTVFSSMDPVPAGTGGMGAMPAAVGTAPAGSTGPAGMVRAAGVPMAVRTGSDLLQSPAEANAARSAASQAAAVQAAAAQVENEAEEEAFREPGSIEKLAFLTERRIRAREQEKAQARLRGVMAMSAQSEGDMSQMLDDFREAASSGQILLRAKAFSPQLCLENILHYEDAACTEKSITLRYYRDSRLPSAVRGFGALLHRALCELLENAIAATPQGGAISVHCRADRPADGIINMYFRIDDSGIGISPSRMQTIFEADHGDNPGRKVHSGLFAAKEAAALMGGSIHARSGPGGSRFVLSVALQTVEEFPSVE